MIAVSTFSYSKLARLRNMVSPPTDCRLVDYVTEKKKINIRTDKAGIRRNEFTFGDFIDV